MASFTLVAPGVWRLRLGTPEAVSPMTIREIPPRVEALAQLPAVAAPPFASEAVHFHASARGTLLELPMAPGEDLYGFGLQLKSVRATGKKRTIRVNSDPIGDTGDSHAPVPYYLSTAGYAVLVDTARYASFYCGSHLPFRDRSGSAAPRSQEIAGDTSTLYGPRTTIQRQVQVEIPLAQGVDVYVFAGPAMGEALRRYVLFSGGGCLPPLWGLGVWYRCCGKMNQAQALDLAQRLRDTHMPIDVYGLEPGWQSHSYSCSYVWDQQRFPEPAAAIRTLRDAGYQINLWEHVFVSPSSPLYGPLKTYAGDLEVWGGLVPDLTIPAARQLFADYHEQELVAKGITGFKLDECDNSDFISFPWSFPEHSRFPSGLDGEQMHSLLGTLYQQTMHQALRRQNVRTLSEVRSAHALAAPYPFVLYSDLYEHRDFVRGVVTAGLSGLLWSPEVRQCGSTEELLRRIAVVVCSPQALVNAWMIMNPPWWQVDHDKNNRGEWMPDRAAAEAAVRRLFELRMRLLPYLYAAFARYHYEGQPPFRALVADYPADPHVRDTADAYMMGDDILVAPVFTGQQGRDVYLPAGGWYDFWTGARYAGGQVHAVYCAVDRIPLFVKENTLLPLAAPVEHTTPGMTFDLTVRAYGPQPAPCRLLVDDGTTHDYERGVAWLTLSWDAAAGGSAALTGAATQARYRVLAWERIG